jgi:fructose-1,6-bisphosphatase I
MILDARAHKEMVQALRRGGVCALIGSEEHPRAIPLKASGPDEGKYIVLMDPLDGSSNIDVNVSVGTIFAIYSIPPESDKPSPEDALQPGANQAAAGYVVYGSSTMMVYTTGDGVNGFTLEPSIGEFILSHPDITVPPAGNTYSINAGYWNSFSDGLVRYLRWTHEDDADARKDGRPYQQRYIGSFVSDFHRNLLKGGIYIYPAIPSSPGGKLRLMYEANPMAFIAEQAGGRATDGHRRILDIEPTKLHQRTPLFIGSDAMVRKVEEFLGE